MAAKTNFWICSSCGFVNTPHAFRRGDANLRCEQDGSKREGAIDEKGDPIEHFDIAPQDAVIAKRA